MEISDTVIMISMEEAMNTKKYYLYQFMKELIPAYPLYALMFEYNGLSVLQISMLLSIWSVPAIILEIPTGILADIWSRKRIIVLGKVLKGLCYVTWLFADSFSGFAVGFLFWGTGSAFVSGTEEALLFDSLKLRGEEDRFEQVLGKGQFLSGISTLSASVAGGLIGMYLGFQTALLLSVLTGAVTTGIALSFQEVNLYRSRQKHINISSSISTLGQSARFIIQNSKVLMISLLSLLVILTAGVLDEYDQLIAEDYGLTISLIGIWTAIRFLFMSFGSYLAGSVRRAMERNLRIRDRMGQICILCIAAGCFLAVSGIVRYVGVMILYGLYYLIMSACGVLQEDYVQQKIDHEGRATVHSITALAQNLCGICFFGLIGIVMSRTDLSGGLIFIGIYIIVITFVTGGFYLRIRHREQEQYPSGKK